ncbi:rRNA methyltransferase 2, mitochondrial-like [Anneissia japonica]|uniref:rRNA methyltransferase 2, mitochondrial-like n=1 Tax=Anneissia japonica TaxID=1529436 RepID=UPI001425B0F1|nr:rRNA methyltransferase 2, mitochondrial-like [Anneissia japonica]
MTIYLPIRPLINAVLSTEQSKAFKTVLVLGCTSLHTSCVQNRKNSSSSKRWIARHMKDPFVKEAQVQHYRARSAFKLLEINDRFQLFKPGDVVIDCGAAPGSWSQVAADKVNALSNDKTRPQGKVVAIDILEFDPIPGVTTLSNCDFMDEKNQSRIVACLQGKMANSVISDMAPNATGMKDLDHENIIRLASAVASFTTRVLKNNGIFLCKVWDGYECEALKKELSKSFTNCRSVRPEASRKESAELFIFARGYRRPSSVKKGATL